VLFHTMVGSNDIERSRRFYDRVLGVLGVGEATLNVADSGHTRLFYSKENGTNFIVSQPINDEPATVANGSTVAFSCSSPEQVREFHDVAVANGGTSVEAAPGPRKTASMGTLELAYVRDPDGNKLCGIHFPE
jgi:catechol 2,3-dioxygenase-like lactoylglutathione lyase family enzyme